MRVTHWLVVVAAFLLVGVLYLRLGAGGPIAFLPGGVLRGERVSKPVPDWSFANRFQSLEVESRARLLPYSRRCWFIAHGERLYLLLPSLFGDGLMRRLEEDSYVRVRIDGRVYEQSTVRVQDESEIEALVRPALRRQFAIEISGEVRRVASAGPDGSGVELWVYRLEERRPES